MTNSVWIKQWVTARKMVSSRELECSAQKVTSLILEVKMQTVTANCKLATVTLPRIIRNGNGRVM